MKFAAITTAMTLIVATASGIDDTMMSLSSGAACPDSTTVNPEVPKPETDATDDTILPSDTPDDYNNLVNPSLIVVHSSRSRYGSSMIAVDSNDTMARFDRIDADDALERSGLTDANDTMVSSGLTGANDTTTATNATVVTPAADCYQVSVERDATYCIQGPVCSGIGMESTGSLCPLMGDRATADCYDYLASYGASGCILPVNSICQPLNTGVWGCVLPSVANSSATTPLIRASVMTAGTYDASNDSTSAGFLVSISIGAACVAAVAGFALYKKRQRKSTEASQQVANQQTFVDVKTP